MEVRKVAKQEVGSVLTLSMTYEGRTGLPMCDPWDWNMGYDANGNLSYDESHNITNVSYNHLNQPTSICFADGSEIDNRYTSGGTKWESTYILPDGTQSVTKYLGNAVVRDGKLDMLRTPWGYIDGDGKAHYYVTDYQGNVTHTVNDNAEIEQSVYYYPDGEPWLEPTGKNPYLFGGKERISFAGLRQYDFGARMLNSTVGSWWQVDPKCEDYYSINPYSPMGANPVMYTDPTGAEIVVYDDNRKGWFWMENENGWAFRDAESKYSGDNEFIKKVGNALDYIMAGPTGKALVESVARNETVVSIQQSKESMAISDKSIQWNPDGVPLPTTEGFKANGFIELGHEIAHIQANLSGMKFEDWGMVPGVNKVISKSEIFTTHIENCLRAEHQLPLRTHYSTDYRDLFLFRILDHENRSSIYFNSENKSTYNLMPLGTLPYIY